MVQAWEGCEEYRGRDNEEPPSLCHAPASPTHYQTHTPPQQITHALPTLSAEISHPAATDTDQASASSWDGAFGDGSKGEWHLPRAGQAQCRGERAMGS